MLTQHLYRRRGTREEEWFPLSQLTSMLACQLIATASTWAGSVGRVSTSVPEPSPLPPSGLSWSEPSERTDTIPWRIMSTEWPACRGGEEGEREGGRERDGRWGREREGEKEEGRRGRSREGREEGGEGEMESWYWVYN